MSRAPLTFEGYQRWFVEYDRLRGLEEDRPLEAVAHLTEEGGEIARHVLRLEGIKPLEPAAREAEIEALALELSDALVFLTKLANHYGIDLDRTIRRGMEKAEARWDVGAGREEAARRRRARRKVDNPSPDPDNGPFVDRPSTTGSDE